MNQTLGGVVTTVRVAIFLSAILGTLGLAAMHGPARGEDATATSSGAVKTDTTAKVSALDSEDDALTDAEKAERAARRGCKIKICNGFHGDGAEGANASKGPLSCDVVKSWRKSQLDKIVGKLKVSWPYGPVVCRSQISLDNDDLGKALKADHFELTLTPHSVSCMVHRDKGEPTEINMSFAPTVIFEKGVATKASVNWGTVKAPMLLKGLLWTATAADNKTHLLSGMLVDDINAFIGKKCDEVRKDPTSDAAD